MRKSAILITGANGEIGRGLILSCQKLNTFNIVTLDINKLDNSIKPFVEDEITGDILDIDLINQLNKKYKFESIYHLAALLSTQSELSPILAHNVNVQGTLNFLNLAIEQGKLNGKKIKFFFPSSIAVYGLKDLQNKKFSGTISEDNFLNPITIYGCNKLYCEHLGSYFSKYHYDMKIEKINSYIDFRSIRFPGIISSQTIPTGGTSDYLPEMIHRAAQGKSYKCFVRKDSKIPFMTMPDAIKAIQDLMQAPANKLNKIIYNVKSFSPTVNQFFNLLVKEFPNFYLEFEINEKRQKMVDSWPEDLDDRSARLDWNWNPDYDLETGLNKYLIPEIKKLYS